MRIEWTEYLLAFCGGLIISLATSFNLLFKGRITGMSSIISGVVSNNGTTWKLSILAGMIITSCISWIIFGFSSFNDNKTYVFQPPASAIQQLDFIGFAIAGLLVGAGTRLGSGCTSGHGVCGLPRLSLRSFVAVGVFMTFGIAVATLRQNFPFLTQTQGVNVVTQFINYDFFIPIVLGVVITLYIVYLINLVRYQALDVSNILVSFITGVLFAIGLIMSGMAKREKVLGFLTINDNWDPSLALVMAGAALPNFLTFHFILKRDKPIFATQFEISTVTKLTFSLIAGAALFGTGWGLAGICPGPAYVLAPIFTPHVSLLFLTGLVIGHYSVILIQEKSNKNQEQNTKAKIK